MLLRGAAQRPPCLQDPGSYSQPTTRLPSSMAVGLARSALLDLHLARTRPRDPFEGLLRLSSCFSLIRGLELHTRHCKHGLYVDPRPPIRSLGIPSEEQIG
jgi:hypothetical protein